MGRENFARQMIVDNPANYYTVNSDGSMTYKPQFYSLNEQEQQYVAADAARRMRQKANGGYLTVKRRRK